MGKNKRTRNGSISADWGWQDWVIIQFFFCSWFAVTQTLSQGDGSEQDSRQYPDEDAAQGRLVLFIISVLEEPRGHNHHQYHQIITLGEHKCLAAVMWHSWHQVWHRAGSRHQVQLSDSAYPTPTLSLPWLLSQLPRPFGPQAPVLWQYLHTQSANVTYPSSPPVKLHLHKPAFVSDDSPVFSLYLSTCRLILQSLSGQPQSRRQNQMLRHALNAN